MELVWLVDIVNLIFVDCCLFQYGGNTVCLQLFVNVIAVVKTQ
jgi:hypothetical protein